MDLPLSPKNKRAGPSELNKICFFGESRVGKTFLIDVALRITESPYGENENYDVAEWIAMMHLEGMGSKVDAKRIVSLDEIETNKADFAVVTPPNVENDMVWFVNDDERESERTSTEAWKNLDGDNMASFLLRKGRAGQGCATTQHNLRIRYAAKYFVLVEYESKLDVCNRLAGFGFRSDEEKIAHDESNAGVGSDEVEDELRNTEEDIMEALLRAVAESPNFELSKFIGKDIKFNDDAEHCFGKVLAFLSKGKNITDDRIYVRRILNQLLFHGLDKHGTPFSEFANAGSGDASTKLIKNVWLYAPSTALLSSNAEWVDCPGCNDVNAGREGLLQTALTECDSLVFLANKLDSGVPLQMFKKYIVPRLNLKSLATNSLDRRLNTFAFVYMNEKDLSLERAFHNEEEFKKKTGECKERVRKYLGSAFSVTGKLSPESQNFVDESFMHVFPGMSGSLHQRHVLECSALLARSGGDRLINFLSQMVTGDVAVEDDMDDLA